MARNFHRIWMWIIPVAIIAAGVFYYFVNPVESNIAPKCPMKFITGYQCPSCGAQRAIHACLHGRIAEAVKESNMSPASYMLADKYIATLKEMVSGKDNKTVYLPYEASNLLGSIGTIKEMFKNQ